MKISDVANELSQDSLKSLRAHAGGRLEPQSVAAVIDHGHRCGLARGSRREETRRIGVVPDPEAYETYSMSIVDVLEDPKDKAAAGLAKTHSTCKQVCVDRELILKSPAEEQFTIIWAQSSSA